MRIGGLEDDRLDSAAFHITFGPQLGRHRQSVVWRYAHFTLALV